MRDRSQLSGRRLVPTMAASMLVFAPVGKASAYNLTTLHSFCAQSECTDGEEPGELVMAPSGTLYGTATGGGYGVGVVYELVPNDTKTKWTYHRLHGFCKAAPCKDGSTPIGHLVLDANGSLFGTADNGGKYGRGVFFQLTHSGNVWTYKVVHSFNNGSEGYVPVGGLTYAGQYSGALWDDVSPLYGVTSEGATHNMGAAYEITDRGQWSFAGIHAFSSGTRPNELIMDDGGRLFGTHAKGGANGDGLLYRLTLTGGVWKEATLHNFCADQNCADGATPAGRLLLDTQGDIFGVASEGGNGGNGVVFERTASGTYKVLYDFCSLANCVDGSGPTGELSMDVAGNLFGTTSLWGTQGESDGIVFKLVPGGSAWTESVIYDFCSLVGCLDGWDPLTGVIIDSSGDLIGTTRFGGTHGDFGTVFELEP